MKLFLTTLRHSDCEEIRSSSGEAIYLSQINNNDILAYMNNVYTHITNLHNNLHR